MQTTVIHRYLVSWESEGKLGHTHIEMGPNPWQTSGNTVQVMDEIKRRAELDLRPIIASVFYMGEFEGNSNE
jgi:hypothetical protein